MLFFPPFLGGAMQHGDLLGKGAIPFVAFCLASSSSYIVNDILDAEQDALHPFKKFRPISSGLISRRNALTVAGALVSLSIVLAFSVSRMFTVILLAYLMVSVSYSLLLKELVIVDLFSISAGFLLRLQGGGEAFGVAISEWLFLSVFLLSLFLSTGKRLCEKTLLGESAGGHRKSLTSYPDGFLDGVLYLTGASALMTYTMYSLPRYPLVYTVPLCTFGLLRYMFRVKSGLNSDPTESLLKDVSLSITGLIWVFLVGWSIYR
jgi:4-hydroxybenzoate polyprenyltransferase